MKYSDRKVLANAFERWCKANGVDSKDATNMVTYLDICDLLNKDKLDAFYDSINIKEVDATKLKQEDADSLEKYLQGLGLMPKPKPIKIDFSEQIKKEEEEVPFCRIMKTINKIALRMLDQIMFDQIILIYNGKYKTYKAYIEGVKEAHLNSGFGYVGARVLDEENYKYIKKQGKARK